MLIAMQEMIVGRDRQKRCSMLQSGFLGGKAHLTACSGEMLSLCSVLIESSHTGAFCCKDPVARATKKGCR